MTKRDTGGALRDNRPSSKAVTVEGAKADAAILALQLKSLTHSRKIAQRELAQALRDESQKLSEYHTALKTLLALGESPAVVVTPPTKD